MSDSILARIRKEKQDFDLNEVEVSPGYKFNQRKTLQRIENYLFSRFESGPLDEDGWTKPFYNVVRKPCTVASKEIDLDTKDIIVRPQQGDYTTAEIMAEDLKQWMKDEGFAADLNEYADLCPQFGTVVIKKVRDRLRTVNLKTLIVTNTQAKSLDHTNIIEPHCYAREEFLAEAKKLGWDADKVAEVLAAYDAAGVVDIEVDERYGWVKRSDLQDGLQGKEADEMVYTMCLAAGTALVEKIAPQKDGDPELTKEKGVVLMHAEIAEHPYREWHWSRMNGRWLGVGFVEMLFDAQVRANENAYYKAKALGWIGVHFFFSDDDTITRNLLNDAKNGDIIRGAKGSQLMEVQMQERNLAYYGSEENRWDKNVADLTFSPDVISGEGLPSGTPARSAIISDQNVKRYFDRKREDFGIFVKDLIENDIMPLFMKDKKEAHTFSFSGSGMDRDALEQRILNTRMVAIFEDYLTKRKRLPSMSEWQRALMTERQKIAGASTLDIKIPEGAYDNLKYRLDVVITKENEDTDSMLAGRQTVLKIMAMNPGIATSPVTRPLFLEIANLMGVKNLSLPTEAEISSTPGNLLPPGAPGSPAPAPGGAAAGAGNMPSPDIMNAVPTPTAS